MHTSSAYFKKLTHLVVSAAMVLGFVAPGVLAFAPTVHADTSEGFYISDNGANENSGPYSELTDTGNEGGFYYLKAYDVADDTQDTSVTWQSSDDTIVSVDASGTATINGGGTATITATDNSATPPTATFTIFVRYILSYSAGANGHLTGSALQRVKAGLNGTAVSAVADPGFQFTSWTDSSTANPRTDTNVNSDGSFTASFAPTAAATYTITVTQGTNGTIAPDTQANIASGTDVPFTITPDSGFQVADVTVDGSSVGAVASYTFTSVTVDHTITASFSPVLSDLTALDAEIVVAQNAVASATVGTDPGDYTQTSVDTLNAAIAAAQTVTDTQPQSDVNTAVTTLTAAVSAFTPIGASDLSTLTADIAAAQALLPVTEGTTPGDHVVGSSATLQAAIATAQAITPADTQSLVDAADVTLNAAVATFNSSIVPPSDLTALDAEIVVAQNAVAAQSGNIGDNPGQYTQASVDTLNAAIVTAEAVTPAQSQTDVDAATATLTSAVSAFAPVSPSDVFALNAAKVIAESLIAANAPESTTPGDHTVGSLATLSAADAAANATSADAQSVVDAQTLTLNTAIAVYSAAIVPPSDLTALDAEIVVAQNAVSAATIGTDPGNYTQGSVDTLNAAIAAAQAVTNTQAQSDVDAAVTTLTSAVSAFTPVPVPTATVPVTAISVIDAINQLTHVTLAPGGSDQLTATITPANATDQTVSWSSDNSTVASVNSSGLITAGTVGTATITATADDTTNGTLTATFAVNVFSPTATPPTSGGGGGGGFGGALLIPSVTPTPTPTPTAPSSISAGQVLGASTASNGALVSSAGTVYLIINNQKRPFASAAEFLSYGFKFSQVVNNVDISTVAPGPVMPAMDGTLAVDTSAGNGTVYLIGDGGVKQAFASAKVFTALGYKFSQVKKINLSSYQAGPVISSSTAAHPDGTLVSVKNTVWWIANGQRHGIPSMSVLASYGLTTTSVVKGNSADLALPTGNVVEAISQAISANQLPIALS